MTDSDKLKIYELRLSGAGYKSIAQALGLSRDSIRSFCKRNRLDGNARVVALNREVDKENHKVCRQCLKPIQQKGRGRTRKFCSEPCRRNWWADHPENRSVSYSATYHYHCDHCGDAFSSYGNKTRKFCSHHCYIQSRFWREEHGIQETAHQHSHPGQLQSTQTAQTR
ncbi:MAG: helix-turn-helix domain-containing protein [Bacillota bacterium]|nr:helix-turn-helix domain-containing protein [Bacillota bacterium]MDW7677833.1 helix-turn-helix domain-containing protein [Bacillota bacterium]